MNPNETILTFSNVNVSTFGLLFKQPVHGQIYGEPLYIPGVTVNGAPHNLVIVATEENRLYAFDGDSNTGANASALWHRDFNFGPSGVTVTPVPWQDVGVQDIYPRIGITGTPVIDPATNILYVAVKTKEVSTLGTKYVQRLHAIDITTGLDKMPARVIGGQVNGACGNSDGNGHIVFDALLQNQRSGLVLANGLVYIAWGSHGDNGAYNGWVIGYNKSTLHQVAVFNSSALNGAFNGDCRAGIWESGAAPAVDSSGSLFLTTGNGAFDANTGGSNYGDTVLKLSPGPQSLAAGDYFTPSNQGYLDQNDIDLGSGGVALFTDQPGPNPHLMVAAGKAGTIYLLNRDNLGQYNSSGDTVVQELVAAINTDGSSPFPPPVVFGTYVYYAASYDKIKLFELVNGLFQPAGPVAESQNQVNYAGAGLSLSCEPGGGNAILWALEGTGSPGTLHAYRGSDLFELYNTNQAAGGRDVPDAPVKFAIPTVVNGKVYLGTSSSLDVYGPLP